VGGQLAAWETQAEGAPEVGVKGRRPRAVPEGDGGARAPEAAGAEAEGENVSAPPLRPLRLSLRWQLRRREWSPLWLLLLAPARPRRVLMRVLWVLPQRLLLRVQDRDEKVQRRQPGRPSLSRSPGGTSPLLWPDSLRHTLSRGAPKAEAGGGGARAM